MLKNISSFIKSYSGNKKMTEKTATEITTRSNDITICFESGHIKSFVGEMVADSIWIHFDMQNGTRIHINKDKIEYIEIG